MLQSGQEGDLLPDLSVGVQQVLGLFGEVQELSDGGLLEQAINITQENLHRNVLPGMLHKENNGGSSAERHYIHSDEVKALGSTIRLDFGYCSLRTHFRYKFPPADKAVASLPQHLVLAYPHGNRAVFIGGIQVPKDLDGIEH